MSILKSTDGNEMIISCNCGCDDSIHIKFDRDDESDIYFCSTFLSGNFYKEQKSSFFIKLKKIIAVLRNKDYYYSDICMTKEQFNQFKEYINQF